MTDSRPIGIFDSGLGGLTVLKALATAFPQESFLYVGDVARLPYGNKSPETIRRYGEQVLQFLLSRDVKSLVIACNTASTVFLTENSFGGIPLYNVIAPGAEAAVAACKNGQVGVIGTNTTVQGHAYLRTIQNLNSSLNVTEVACPLFVPLAEEGMGEDEVTRIMATRYLSSLSHVDTLVLGCTHYPLLKHSIEVVMGPKVKLIESGNSLADMMGKHLVRTDSKTDRKLEICTTDVTGAFERLAQQIMAPEKLAALERVVL